MTQVELAHIGEPSEIGSAPVQFPAGIGFTHEELIDRIERALRAVQPGVLSHVAGVSAETVRKARRGGVREIPSLQRLWDGAGRILGLEAPDALRSRTKQCTHCHRILPVSEFSRRSRARDGLQPWCRSCTNDFRVEQTQHREPVIATSGRSLAEQLIDIAAVIEQDRTPDISAFTVRLDDLEQRLARIESVLRAFGGGA